MKTLLIPISIMFIFSGCATSYQNHGLTGGYKDEKINDDIYNVHFFANGFTKKSDVSSYFLRRCAEVTVENNFDYFAFIDKNSSGSSMGVGTTSFSSGVATTAFVPITSSHAEGMIKTYKEGSQPQNAINAHSILKKYQK